jgi:hypothetical protein
VIVAENTSVGSRTRSSTVVDTTDGNIAVVSNIFAQNATYVNPQFTDARYHVAGTSPAVDMARNDYAYFPDLDEVQGVMGSGPDSGAYER